MTASGEEKPNSKPLIIVEPGKLHEACDAAEQALIYSGLPIFYRDGAVVQVVGLQQSTKGIQRPAGAPQIVQVETGHLLRVLSSVADFAKPKRGGGRRKGRGKGDAAKQDQDQDYEICDPPVRLAAKQDQDQDYEICDPPVRLADAIRLNPESLLPRLVAFIEAPILDRDLRLHDKPGYIPDLGLLLTGLPECWKTTTATHWPDSSDANDDQLQSAAKELRDLLSTFMFEDPCDLAAAVAMIITGLLRRVLPAAPIFGITAPTPATGKSLLSDVVSIICTGRPAAVMSMGDDPAELEKRLGAVLMAGDNFLSIDNISVPLKSDLLCSITTQPEALIRVLGVSKRSKLTTRTLIVLTGNNLTIRGDLTRRVVPVRLNAQCEQPEKLRFDGDPKASAESNRARLIAAALRIAQQKAFLNSDPPKDFSPYGSFKAWDELVRRPLISAGFVDPLHAVTQLRQGDPDLEAHASVLLAWQTAFGSAEMTAHQVCEESTNRELNAAGEPGRLVNPELQEALSLAIGGRTGTYSARSLGYWLRTRKDRPIAGLVLRHAGTRRNLAVWVVENV